MGSGHGHFLAAYAKAHPSAPCVGVDIASDRVARANRKRERGGLSNLRFLRASAEDFLEAAGDDIRMDPVFILFPDPWPKRRHHKNRVMTVEFLDQVAARADAGAALFFRTDYEPYFLEVESLIADHPRWDLRRELPWPFEEKTVFEKRASGHFSLGALRRA